MPINLIPILSKIEQILVLSCAETLHGASKSKKNDMMKRKSDFVTYYKLVSYKIVMLGLLVRVKSGELH